MIARAVAFAALAALSAPALAKPASDAPIVFPDQFDSIGTPVQSVQTASGRTVHFTDTGEAGWKPLLLIGGVGTSGRAPELVAFLDTMRRRLKVRIIAVERNGLGDTAYDPDWTFADYTSDVKLVLDKLKIGRFSLSAISGGGAYAGHVVAAMPERIASWHMLAAVSSSPAGGAACGVDQATLEAQLAPQVQAPRVWWEMPHDGVAAHVRGFDDRTADEGARAFFIAGQKGDTRGVAREYKRFCDAPAQIKGLKAPAFFYYGTADKLVPPSHGAFWGKQVEGKVTYRTYPGEGHDVQYRHWDQLLLDVAGYGDRTLVCDSGRAHLVAGPVDPGKLPKGRTLGVCAWAK